MLRREGEEEGDEGELERLRKGKYIPSRRLVHLGLSDLLLILVMLVLVVKIFQLILTIRMVIGDIGDEDDMLRYEGSSSTDVLPHRLAPNHERFHNGLAMAMDYNGNICWYPTKLISSMLLSYIGMKMITFKHNFQPINKCQIDSIYLDHCIKS